MKTIIFFSLLLSVYPDNCAQIIKINPASGKYYAEGIIKVDSINRDSLFHLTYRWLKLVKYVDTQSASKGISLSDENISTIVIHQGYVPSPEASKYFAKMVRFVITLEFKDYKIKYNYTDFRYLSNYLTKGYEDFEKERSPREEEPFVKLTNDVENYVTSSMSELREYLNNYNQDNAW